MASLVESSFLRVPIRVEANSHCPIAFTATTTFEMMN